MITYGMSSKSLAERINKSQEEADKIISDFYKGFDGVKKLTDASQEMLIEKGYVTDMWGRRRHIPDAQLPKYSITSKYKKSSFNPLIGAVEHIDTALANKIDSYRDKLDSSKSYKQTQKIIADAKRDGLNVVNNGLFISRALRQCLNARIQGTAASMTKYAMILLDQDEELNRLGFKLSATIHDEVWGICPTENSERAGERVCEVMCEAAKSKCGSVAWKCDPYIVSRWYEDEFVGEVKKDYAKLNDLDLVKSKYKMINPKYIEQMCLGTYECNKNEDI